MLAMRTIFFKFAVGRKLGKQFPFDHARLKYHTETPKTAADIVGLSDILMQTQS